MHLIWSSEVKCIVTVWFLWSFWYILSNGVGDVTNRWRHFWFTSQHQSDLKYITHNSGSHYCFYYRSHQHTRTRNKNIYIAIKDYPQIRVWSYLPQVVHSFWERPIYIYLACVIWLIYLIKHQTAAPEFSVSLAQIFQVNANSRVKPQPHPNRHTPFFLSVYMYVHEHVSNTSKTQSSIVINNKMLLLESSILSIFSTLKTLTHV